MTKRNKSTNRKGEPPIPLESSLNLSTKAPNDREGLNFWVTPEFKTEYKIFAAERGMKMKDVLQQSFDLFKASHGYPDARKKE